MGYWHLILEKILRKKISPDNYLMLNIDSEGKNFYDGNPIFSYFDDKSKKALRIIQEDVKSYDNKIESKLIDAWIDNIDLYDQNDSSKNGSIKLNELVIALLLSDETVAKSKTLIELWFKDNLSEDLIEELLKNKD